MSAAQHLVGESNASDNEQAAVGGPGKTRSSDLQKGGEKEKEVARWAGHMKSCTKSRARAAQAAPTSRSGNAGRLTTGEPDSTGHSLAQHYEEVWAICLRLSEASNRPCECRTAYYFRGTVLVRLMGLFVEVRFLVSRNSES